MPTLTSSSRFPQEIIDNVIDELFGLDKDKKSLSSVALTSQSCLNRARSYLFGTIDLERSSCPLSNCEDSATLRSLLTNSLSIRFYIRKLIIGSLYFFPFTRSHRPVDCDVHAGTEAHHIVTWDISKDYSVQKLNHLTAIASLIASVRSIQINYCETPPFVDWHEIAIAVEQNPIAPFCLQASLTSLTLSLIKNLPFSLLRSVLKLSRLTSLILDFIVVEDDCGAEKTSVQCLLTNLQIFGLVLAPGSAVDMYWIGTSILSTASRSLRRLQWLDFSGMRSSSSISIQGLVILEELTMHGFAHRSDMKSLLIQIMASNKNRPSTLKVLEVREMDGYNEDFELEYAEGIWAELDEILKDDTFSNLIEIRLLFTTIQTMDTIIVYSDPELGRTYTTEEVASKFASFCPHAVARGVKVTYGVKLFS